MSRVTEIRYVGYGCPDLAAERDFYGTVWGLKSVGEHADGLPLEISSDVGRGTSRPMVRWHAARRHGSSPSTPTPPAADTS